MSQAVEVYSREEMLRKIAAIDAFLALHRENRLANYRPLPKQETWHNLSADHSYTALLGGNGSGKSVPLAASLAIHATGLYPDWWKGRRFRRAPRWAVGSVSFDLSRDNIQRLLLGQPGQWGTGLIPKGRIKSISRRGGPPVNTVDTVFVEHESGGIAELKLKAYNQGVEDWMAVAYDGVAFDEESTLEIYEQAVQRVGRRGGIILLAMTPEKGWTDLVTMFMKTKPKGTAYLHIAKDDNPIYTKEMIEQEMASTRPHMRDTKRYGIPSPGEGAVYPVADSEIVVQPFPIPAHWRRGVGIDFGMRCTAAAWGAYDADADCIYIYKEYKAHDQPVPVHADALRGERGIPLFGDPAGSQRTPAKGETTFKLYADKGIRIIPAENSHAWVDHIWERMATGRLKIFATCVQLLDEKHTYQYDKRGEIANDLDDHGMDAMRYAVTMLAQWRTPQSMELRPMPRQIARDPRGGAW